MAEHEKKQIKSNHAEVGAWIIRKWNLPPRICRVIEVSHSTDLRTPIHPAEGEPAQIMGRCVALSGPIADLFLVDGAERHFAEIGLLAERSIGLDRGAFSAVLDAIGAIIPETEAMFDAELLSRGKADQILEQARDVLTIRTLQTLQEFNSLRAEAESSNQRVAQLQKEAQLDPLTGLCNRAYLDLALNRDVERATDSHGPQSLAFCNRDNFKRVKDTYGHQAGDRVLESAARLLRAQTRDSDTLARYGGEEFVIVLPNTDRDTARKVCGRIVRACSDAPHDIGSVRLPVTLSIGCATYTLDAPFENAAELVNAADLALYAAKDRGRNQAVPFAAGMIQPLARVV